MPDIQLRNTKHSDLEHFFLFQLDEEACHLAAFMPKDYNDRDAYMKKYNKLLNDESVNMRTILADGVIAGSISQRLRAHREHKRMGL